MKKLFLTFFIIALICVAFIAAQHPTAATPLRYDESNSGSYTFRNQCTGEDVDVTFQYTESMRGTINGQRFNVKVHYNEQQEGIGRTTGTKYIGHVTDSYSENGSILNNRYSFSQIARVRMNAPGGGNNFKSISELTYSFNSEGEVSSVREQQVSECE